MCSIAFATPDTAKAVESANNWLSLFDAGNYDKAWNDTSDWFKAKLPKSQWQAKAPDMRKGFGKVVKRKLERQQVTTTLPGAPDGNYVILEYKTEFEQKKSADEEVIPYKGKDGMWRVCGYTVR